MSSQGNKPSGKPVRAVVLAAGKGTRMLSGSLAKVMQPLCGLPLLEYPLRGAESCSTEPPVIVIGFGREAVRKAFDSRNIIWAVQKKQLGTAHAVSAGLNAIPEFDDGDIVVLNGDLPHLAPKTLREIVMHHQKSGADGTIMACRKTDPTGYGRIIRDGNGRTVKIVEERDATAEIKEIREINAGVYIYKASVLRRLVEAVQPKNVQNEYYLTDIVELLFQQGGRGETYCLEDETEIDQITSRYDIARSSKRIFLNNALTHMRNGDTIVNPETTFIDKDVEIGCDSVILPFSVIRRGARIGERCEIGPFTHVREGSVIMSRAEVGNFTETKNTIIGQNSKAKHLSYLGDGIIGTGVNIGAGTIFANYDGKDKHKTRIEDNAFVGSGSILVAPVSVGERATTGAGAVVTKNKNVESGEVVVGVPARSITLHEESNKEHTETKQQ